MSIYSFKTNKQWESDQGVNIDYGKEKFRILRAGRSNRRYSDILNKRLRPYQRQLADGTLDPAIGEKIMIEVYADTIIIGWEGVCDEHGNYLEFNRDNVIRILTDLPDLFADIQEQAGRLSTFRDDEIESDRKN